MLLPGTWSRRFSFDILGLEETQGLSIMGCACKSGGVTGEARTRVSRPSRQCGCVVGHAAFELVFWRWGVGVRVGIEGEDLPLPDEKGVAVFRQVGDEGL